MCVMVGAESLGGVVDGALILISVVATFIGGTLPLESEAPKDGTFAVVDADARPVAAVVSTCETDAGLEAAVIISGSDSNDATPWGSPSSLWRCCRSC